jgi:hypothetical protein
MAGHDARLMCSWTSGIALTVTWQAGTCQGALSTTQLRNA